MLKFAGISLFSVFILSSSFLGEIFSDSKDYLAEREKNISSKRPCPPCVWDLSDDELERRFNEANATISWEQMQWFAAEHKRCGCTGPDVSAKTLKRLVDEYNEEKRKHFSFRNITMREFQQRNRRNKRASKISTWQNSTLNSTLKLFSWQLSL